MNHRTGTCLALLFLPLVSATVVTDVSYWTHGAAADHAEATEHNVIVTNYGDVQLTRQLEVLAAGVEGVSVVYALAEGRDGTIYAATGPAGVLLRIKNQEMQRLVVPETTNLFAIAFDGNGQLLVGAGGDRARLIRVGIDGDQINTETVFEHEGVSYIWRIVRHDDGTLYVATGPTGALYEIRPGAPSRELFRAAGEKNLLSLAIAGDRIYVGSEPNGLIWDVNRRTGEARVVFDAAEPEITALVVSGNTLFATGAARGEVAEEAEPGAGTPDVLGPSARIDRAPVELPEEPEFPPQEPDRLPLEQDVPGRQPPQEQPDPEQPVPDRAEQPQPGEDVEMPQAGGVGPPVAEFVGEGSALYRIDLNEGRPPMVTGVMRDPALFLDLLAQNGRLLVAAGVGEAKSSRVLQLNAATSELALIAEPDARQIATMLQLSDGRIVLGLANPGGVAMLQAAFAAEGTLTSKPLDAGTVSTFGALQLSGRLPEGTELLVSTRSGNTADPESDPEGWSPWSAPAPARRFMQTSSPAARFFQYRLTLRSNGAATPSVERVRVAYMQPNLPPQVTSIQVNSELSGQEVADLIQSVLESGEPPSTLRGIEWEANDPNGDPLIYDLYVRQGRGEFQLVAADLTEAAYAWDAKAGGDGTYEFRVVAKDARGNPPGSGLTGARVSEPVEVDLSPPRIGDIEVEDQGAGGRLVKLRVADSEGVVARLEYLLKGDPSDAANWIRAFPADGMADSPVEQYEISLEGAVGGVRLRAIDDSGNLTYQTVSVPGR